MPHMLPFHLAGLSPETTGVKDTGLTVNNG